jgi:phospholipase/lecithinase/hemolysin
MKILTAFFSLLLSSVLFAAPLNNIVVFGDSLSDNGNLYEFMHQRMPISPPYFEGRFSNGPLWVERLADSYFPENGAAHLLDYAFGGAGILEEDDDEVLFTLKHEIEIYLLAHEEKADPNSLFAIWIGANNYLALPENGKNTVHYVNAGIRQGMERLVKAGAKHILILDLPDLGKTPVAREFEAEERLTYFSQLHNEMLVNTMYEMKVKYPNVQWIHFDIHQAFKDILDTPEQYGFTNTHDTCYDTLIKTSSKRKILTMATHLKKMTKNEFCEGYVFFDPVHTTAKVHQILADRVRLLLDSLGVVFS